jgi:hypothetical protein
MFKIISPRTALLIGGLAITAGGLAIIPKIQTVKQKLLNTGQEFYQKSQSGAQALASLDTETAKNAFGDLSDAAQDLKTKADSFGFGTVLKLGENLTPRLRALSSAVNDAIALSGNLASLAEKTDLLADRAFPMAMNGEGAALLAHLDEIQKQLANAGALQERLKSSAAVWGLKYPDHYSTLSAKLYQAQKIIKSAFDYLNSGSPIHIAILFQNPSEIRPAGGFIGSYADIAVERGSVKQIDVRDIYDPDGQLDSNIIPPLPLRSITNVWEARDANWLFDFPTSAKKVLGFLNQSKIYAEQGTIFTAALALNVRVIEDVLRVLGPIELPEYKMTLGADNFLANVQREVESGEDKRNGEPKRILKVVTPILLGRLANLTSEEKRALAQTFQARIKTKDILAYVEDRALEGYLQSVGIGGEIFAPEKIESDDYLAVVHANIAGGKTDAFMEESISLQSQMDLRGVVLNQLTVERKHLGQNEKEWWYKSPNKDYFQVLTLPGSRLLQASGHDKKKWVGASTKKGGLEDPDISAIERSRKWLPEFGLETFEQFGKNTFGNWLTTHAGEKKILQFEYENPKLVAVAPDTNYRFVFERQSGVKTSLRYSVEAPPGYIWRESGQNAFVYESENPEGRIILDLTLDKPKTAL